jgi:hypothetical protein
MGLLLKIEWLKIKKYPAFLVDAGYCDAHLS